MTALNKPVRRSVTLNPTKRPLEIVVSLYPDGTLGFRDKGRRTEYHLPLITCYMLGAKLKAQEIIEERKRKKAERKREK